MKELNDEKWQANVEVDPEEFDAVVNFVCGQDSIKFYTLMSEPGFREWFSEYITSNAIDQEPFFTEFSQLGPNEIQEWNQLANNLEQAVSFDRAAEDKENKKSVEAKEAVKKFLNENPEFVVYFKKNQEKIKTYQNTVSNQWTLYREKSVLLEYLTNFIKSLREKETVTVEDELTANTVEKFIFAINGGKVDFTQEEKNVLNSPAFMFPLCSSLYAAKNDVFYLSIFPQDLREVMKVGRDNYKLISNTLQNSLNAFIQRRTKGYSLEELARFEQENLKKIKIYEQLIFAITHQDAYASISADDLFLIRSLIPKNILEYEAFLPEKIRENIKAYFSEQNKELANQALEEIIEIHIKDPLAAKERLKAKLLECTPVSSALADILEEKIKDKMVKYEEIANTVKLELKFSCLKVVDMLNEPLEKWQAQCENEANSNNKLITKITPVAQVVYKLDSVQSDHVSLHEILEAGRESATILAKNQAALEQERHPTLRKALYIASAMLMPFGVGILTSAICAVHSKIHYGTFNFFKAAKEGKTVGGAVVLTSALLTSEKAIRPMGIRGFKI